jgi:hypothetical protein
MALTPVLVHRAATAQEARCINFQDSPEAFRRKTLDPEAVEIGDADFINRAEAHSVSTLRYGESGGQIIHTFAIRKTKSISNLFKECSSPRLVLGRSVSAGSLSLFLIPVFLRL